MKCPKCSKQNKTGAKFCGYCGKVLPPDSSTGTTKPSLPISNAAKSRGKEEDARAVIAQMQLEEEIRQLRRDAEREHLQKEMQAAAEKKREEIEALYDFDRKCPYCGSKNLAYGKQGFGYGKAAAGAVLLGPLGLLAGGINANKQQITCQSCHRMFRA